MMAGRLAGHLEGVTTNSWYDSQILFVNRSIQNHKPGFSLEDLLLEGGEGDNVHLVK